MSLAIRYKIADMLQAVSEVGQVHRFEPYAKNQADLRKYYAYKINDTETQLRGWFVSRASATEKRGQDKTKWIIRGYMALSDNGESELVFHDIIDRIRQAFRDKYDLDGLIDTTEADNQIGVQIDDEGPVLFCGVLCHATHLSLMTLGNAELTAPSNLVPFITYRADTDMAPQDQQIDATDEVILDQ